jgi:parallel beta-helix repeat protein
VNKTKNHHAEIGMNTAKESSIPLFSLVVHHPEPLSILLALLAFSASAKPLYVDLNSTNPLSPYADWSTAATNIQDAVDAADPADTITVTNGVYETGGRIVYGAMSNRLAVTKAVTVQSVNGPEVTIIKGYQVPGTTNGDGAVRCVWLTNGAVLSGFTLTNGATRSVGDSGNERSGGGVWCVSSSAVVTNCVLSGNSASGAGGGAFYGTLEGCTLSGNSVSAGVGQGGGAYQATLGNCTLNANSAAYGGAASYSTLTNSTLTGNSARSYGGGTYYGTLNNCIVNGNSAGSGGGGATSTTLSSSTLIGNSANQGGGAYSGSLSNCTLAGNLATNVGGGAYQANLASCTLRTNSAGYGGGAGYSTLTNCALTGNWAPTGGGAYYGTLSNCTLTANAANSGGGACSATVVNCTLTGNSAKFGGGAYSATVKNSAFAGNWANSGGGAWGSSLSNCTLIANSAARAGGGASGCTLNNCIICSNTSQTASNYEGGVLNYCCTVPLPTGGLGNITKDPQLVSAWHLSAGSPCRGAGAGAYATGLDIDGELWTNPPSIGCDEYQVGAVTGPLAPTILAAYTNVAVGFRVDFIALTLGRTAGTVWDFGDGQKATNQVCVSRTWNTPGDYMVTLTAYNEDNPAGVSTTVTVHVQAVVHYVALGSANQVPPYDSWATAAGDIQSAVDAASLPGAVVLVSNGVYRTGGRALSGSMTNRVTVDKPLVVRSLSGPSNTIIEGYQVPITTNGDGAIRCVFLTNGAVLSGFTLTNGATRGSVGLDSEQKGGGVWCTTISAIVTNCILVANGARSGGGGVYHGTLRDCTLARNSAGYGGAAYESTLSNCTLAENSATAGGGTYLATLNNCTLTGNTATDNGGGAAMSALQNCLLSGNSASYGGGASDSTLNSCTVVGNYASAGTGGGVAGATLNNCIIYFNSASAQGANYDNSTLNYCCTTPLPSGGVGNLDLDPAMASISHLSASSPCRGKGSGSYAIGVDIDGEAWANPPSIGCDEYSPGTLTGTLNVAVSAAYTNVAPGFGLDLAGRIDGKPTSSVWDFGDGQAATNQPFITHAWNTPGDYLVVLTAYNDSSPAGVKATVTVHVQAVVHYVALGSTNPVAPYGSWETAAGDIQSAIDAANVMGALVLVSDGVYAVGGRAVYGTMTNRIVVDKPLVVRSVNGPANTFVEGYGPCGAEAIRCAYLTSGAVLSGFTLTNGATQRAGSSDPEANGAGIWCVSVNSIVTNCVLTGNTAWYAGGGAESGTLNNCTLMGNRASWGGGAIGAILVSCTVAGNWGQGGGAYTCTLTNCLLVGNEAYGEGGGAHSSVLNNCTLAGNTVQSYGGGGAHDCTLNNCIIQFNSAGSGGANYEGSTLNYCCTTPLPGAGPGNFTNAPLFVDLAGGDLHLQANSPCINAGGNAYVSLATDLDGNPRIVGGTVDVGAYEYQTPTSTISYAWLQQYGLPTDGSADSGDLDTDGMLNWQEWRAATDPTNALSVLQMLAPSNTVSGVTVTWQSVTNRTYYLQGGANLAAQPAFLTLQTNIIGQAGTTSFTDTNAVGSGPFFYRVGVQ